MFRESSLFILLLLPLLSHAQPRLPVEVKTLDQLLIADQQRAASEVVPLNRSILSAEIAGVVNAVFVDAGQQVSSGDILIELNPLDFQLQLQQAQARLDSAQGKLLQAQLRLQRAQELVEKNFIAADDLLTRETELRVASAQILIDEAAVATAQRMLDKCTIRAPFNGVVNARLAQLGSYVSPGVAMVELTQTDRMEIHAAIPAGMAASLAASTDIRFVAQDGTFPARLLRLSPVIDPQQRTQVARLAFMQDAAAIGSSGELVWLSPKTLLPANLLVRRDSELGVFMHVDGTARFIPLPDAQEGRASRISLPLDTQIIVTGRDRLQDGDSIQTGQ